MVMNIFGVRTNCARNMEALQESFDSKVWMREWATSLQDWIRGTRKKLPVLRREEKAFFNFFKK